MMSEKKEREIQLYGDLYIYDGKSGTIIWQGRMEERQIPRA